MSLSDLASIATVISGIAVVASLIYLAQQTRQNTKHTRALIQQGRSQQIIEEGRTFATDTALREIALRGDSADPALNSDELMAYIPFVMSQMISTEDQYYQYRAGLVAEERWAGTMEWLRTTRAVWPGFRASWTLVRGVFGAQFRALVDDVLREVNTPQPPDLSPIWHALAAEERRRVAPAD